MVDINEELGQVGHIFADKTGTLTKNKMTFERLIIGMYEFCKPIPIEEIPEDKKPEDMRDELLLNMISEDSLDGKKCRFAFRVLTLCHSVQFNDEAQLIWNSPEEFEFLNFT